MDRRLSRQIDYLDLFDTSSSSEDETSNDEELISALNYVYSLNNRRQKIIKVRSNCFDEYDDFEFERRFRLPKFMVLDLADILESSLKTSNAKGQPISVLNQILITLRFYAVGTFQIVIGDLFSVSQPTISRIIKRVSIAIAKLADRYIVFGNIAELKEEFFTYAGIPGIIGIIDGIDMNI